MIPFLLEKYMFFHKTKKLKRWIQINIAIAFSTCWNNISRICNMHRQIFSIDYIVKFGWLKILLYYFVGSSFDDWFRPTFSGTSSETPKLRLNHSDVIRLGRLHTLVISRLKPTDTMQNITFGGSCPVMWCACDKIYPRGTLAAFWLVNSRPL